MKEEVTMTAPGVVRIEFSTDEMRLLRSAVESFASEFGHDESDIRHAAQHLVAKLRQAAEPVTARD